MANEMSTSKVERDEQIDLLADILLELVLKENQDDVSS
jgi:hypothetical protein